MSDITLSKAVRSNLLNLQSTAGLLSKSQERLSTGLRVNSALDNPTNFFTAQGLNSRANDLSQLLDSVSNAVQTVAAADKGITAITKLVESAQATARQALQTAATVATGTAASAGVVTGSAMSGTLDVSGTAGTDTSGSITGGAFTAMNFTVTPASAGTATLTSANFASSTFGVGDTLTFDIAVDGGAATTVTISGADVAGVGNNDATIDDVTELAAAINAAGLPGGVTAAVNGGNLVFTSGTQGASSAVAISNVVANDTSGDGTITNAGLDQATSTAGQAQGPAKTLTFDVAIDGGAATSVTINLAAVQAVGNSDGTIDSVAELASIIDAQLGSGVTVDGSGANLVLTSATDGTSSSVAITNTTATNITNTSGVANGANSGTNGAAADSLTFSVAVDGGSAQTVTISAASVQTYNTAHPSATISAGALTSANIAALVTSQLTGATATVATGGGISITSNTTGTTSSVAITGFTSAGTPTGSTGIANGNNTGQAAATTTGVNPKRAELVTTYNDLLGQIDALAKDSGFNGVNLLNGDNLSVLFNEDGSSKLDITGVTNSATGLSLSVLASSGFDTNSAINATLDDLKASIDTLRSQSAKFGSNLSVVETRQDFTKNMINVLQTGAANLTLADTNEEAANVLALQTRQQLSSTALSLASQADQNVLRLF